MSVDPRPLDYISLCSGGGGLDLGLELAIPSARAICYMEREAFACAHLVEAMQAGWLAPAPIWTDVTTFDGRPWRGLVDGVIGGIPCQPHSVAGRKKGQHDERDLWTAARRIIFKARPWFVLIENVAGMLVAGQDQIAGAERVRRDLRRMGFAVEGGLFTAAEVGPSHRRERVFILGVADPDRRQQPRWGAGRSEASGGRAYDELAGSGSGDVANPQRREGVAGHDADMLGRRAGQAEQAGVASGDVADAGIGRRRAQGHAGIAPGGHDRGSGELEHASRRNRSLHAGQRAEGLGAPDAGGRGISLFPPGPGDAAGWAATLARAPELEPAVRRLADGLAATRVDWLRLLGNGVVPLQAGYAIRTLAARLAATGAAGANELVRMTAGTSMPVAAE